MNNVAVSVDNLYKRYYIGKRPDRYSTLRDTVVKVLATPLRRAKKLLRGQATGAAELDEAIWALNGVSFEVRHGEILGIIGANGAGKSTLLKILSRITEPTKGRVDIHGRVGSLLEVGTGFHHELTGQENIYLNGAILGMTKKEIKQKFDEIVAFAEVEKFIYTPVKHYSSGMYLRLAFAVAAHLDPEILIVDEVLAVGDARFQAKCLQKMQDVGSQGRTVLFVSHNLRAITQLCHRTILLNDGTVVRDGPPSEVVSAYLNSEVQATSQRVWTDPATAPRGEVAQLHAVRVRTCDGDVTDLIDIRQPVGIEMEYQVLKPGHVLLPNFHYINAEGIYLFPAHDLDPAWQQRPRPSGRYISTAWIPGNLLSEGRIWIHVALMAVGTNISQFHLPNVVSFEVADFMGGRSARGDWKWNGNMNGAIRPLLKWSTQFTPDENSTETVVTEGKQTYETHYPSL